MSWKAEYIFLIVASTMADYYAGIQMGKRPEKSQRLPFLVLSLVVNLGLLFAFKYFNFFNDSVRAVFNRFNVFYGVSAFKVLLPVGISFYTFQTLSYSIDVFRGREKPEKHLGIFALYVAFFPQLVAGPIERSTHLIPQFYRIHDFDYSRVVDGLRLMLWGFFKKLVIADQLAIYVDQIYNNPSGYYGIPVIIATYFFAFQIYCDFSGYSDIAIGAAKIMGYDLMENFKKPYFSASIREFWSRWHISLSTWFRDYLYIPLGGNRVRPWRWQVNLLIVFLVSGLWHGANWTFVIWGALHGLYFILSIWLSKIRQKAIGLLPSKISENFFIQKCFAIFITFHLILFAWIFFRANSLSDALLIVSNIFKISFPIQGRDIFGAVGRTRIMIAVLSILFMEFIHIMQKGRTISQLISEKPFLFRWAWYYTMIFSILLFGAFGNSPFIYFQF